MEPTNRLIAALYGGVFTQPLERFQDFALTHLNAVIPYDSTAWASGHDELSTIHPINAVNQSLDDLQLLATRYCQSDPVRQMALAYPGTPVRLEDVMTVAVYHTIPLYYELGRRIGIEQVMATVLIDPVTKLDNLIIL